MDRVVLQPQPHLFGTVVMRNLFAIMAATSLAISPIAAQANTRAGDASVSLSVLEDGPQLFSDDEYCSDDGGVDGDEGCGRSWLWLGILLGVLILGGTVAAIGGDASEGGRPGGNASPGTGG